MSASIDVLERLLREYGCIPEARFLVDAIHQYSHDHTDDLNRDPRVRKAAERLDEALDRRAERLVQLEKTEKLIYFFRSAPSVIRQLSNLLKPFGLRLKSWHDKESGDGMRISVVRTR